MKSIAQSNVDSSIYQNAVTANIRRFNLAIKENIGLFNAPQYLFVSKQSYGFPFWRVDSLLNGNIDYDGNYYENVPLKYDLVNQAVVTTDYSHSALIALLNDKIRSFTIDKHQFYNVDATTNNYTDINKGFYDRLYTGKVTIWARREKKLKNSQNAEEQAEKFVESDQYYIQLGNMFYLITEKANVISTLKNVRAIEMFITQSKIKFDDNIENELIKIAKFYEQLKN